MRLQELKCNTGTRVRAILFRWIQFECSIISGHMDSYVYSIKRMYDAKGHLCVVHASLKEDLGDVLADA